MKAVAVIVCYGPDLGHLRRTCSALIAAGVGVVLVDNTEKSPFDGQTDFVDCTVVVNGANLGIARAQNLGITRALEQGSDAIAFFDQDSKVDELLIRELLRPLGPDRPQVVAPLIRDAARGFEYPSIVITPFGGRRKTYSEGRTEPYSVDVVISSGTVATALTFQRVGMMDEDLFIDLVDTEWCLRCRKHGIRVTVIPKAVLRHSVGSRSFGVGFALVSVHSPLRSYYQIRNCLLLFRKRSVPMLMAVRELTAVLAHKILLLHGVDRRREYLVAYAKGLMDGLVGVTGKKAGT